MTEYRYRDGDPILPFAILGRKSVSLAGYLDTGASTTVVPERIKDQAGLTWLGATSILTVGGIVPENVYLAKIAFEGAVLEVTVLCRDLPGKESLIGRDVLDLFRVCFDGPRKMLNIEDEDAQRRAA